MKCKYVITLLVSLNLGTIFASDIEPGSPSEDRERKRSHSASRVEEKTKYQIAQDRWTAKSEERTRYKNAKSDEERSNALEKYTTEVLQEEAALRELRIHIISMNDKDLDTEITQNSVLYNTSIGISFLYGWMLNQFKGETVTPFYVGKYFNFGSMFGAYLDKLEENAKTLLSPIFEAWVKKLEDLSDEEKQRTKFDFLFDGIIPLHYAIEQARMKPKQGESEGEIEEKLDAPYNTPQELFRETLYSPVKLPISSVAPSEHDEIHQIAGLRASGKGASFTITTSAHESTGSGSSHGSSFSAKNSSVLTLEDEGHYLGSRGSLNSSSNPILVSPIVIAESLHTGPLGEEIKTWLNTLKTGATFAIESINQNSRGYGSVESTEDLPLTKITIRFNAPNNGALVSDATVPLLKSTTPPPEATKLMEDLKKNLKSSKLKKQFIGQQILVTMAGETDNFIEINEDYDHSKENCCPCCTIM